MSFLLKFQNINFKFGNFMSILIYYFFIFNHDLFFNINWFFNFNNFSFRCLFNYVYRNLFNNFSNNWNVFIMWMLLHVTLILLMNLLLINFILLWWSFKDNIWKSFLLNHWIMRISAIIQHALNNVTFILWIKVFLIILLL